MVIVCSSSSCIGPTILNAITIVRPETLVRWHRAGFRRYWRWKSHSLGGRPQIDADLRALIRRMSIDNPLWGAPRIHGELLKLGFEVAQSSVAKYYMVKRCGPASPGWRAFLHTGRSQWWGNEQVHGVERRKLVWINVTPRPRNGLHARPERHSLGLKPHVT